ncbi:Low-density lipoprotein receptor domain class A [Ostertagia ostertagi]
MSLPVDPTLDCSAAQYSLESNQGRPPLTSMPNQDNMYTPRSAPQQHAEGANDSLPKTGLERFRDYIGRTCCSCFLKLPVVVIVIAICIIVALLLALIPAVVILTSAVDSESQRQVSDGVDMQIIRDTHLFPKPDPLDDEDDILDGLRRDGVSIVHGIPSTALFPPNVSLCEGFGFACTIQPSMVISTALRCDGKSDCPDGSDELNCRECQSAFSCSVSTKSKVKVCLRAEQLCDGITHCPDEYDEHKHCKDECDDDELKCPATSLCLPPTSVCDGIVDCDTEDDETNCKKCKRGSTVDDSEKDDHWMIPRKAVNNGSLAKKTIRYQPSCEFCEPTKRCIPAGQICDGIPQCPDGSDEKECDCRSCSGSGKALCADGTCLERSRVCDGIVDCSDGADEEDCPGTCILDKNVKVDINVHWYTVCDGIEDCSGGEDERDCSCAVLNKFECRSASGKTKCISKDKVCDGVWDCMDGKDETNCGSCPSNSIRCPGEGTCIPKISRCDGVADCRDGSDEKDCTCEECIGNHWNTYMCGATSHCFRREEVCAPYTLCPNATKADKVYCAGRAVRGMDWLE